MSTSAPPAYMTPSTTPVSSTSNRPHPLLNPDILFNVLSNFATFDHKTPEYRTLLACARVSKTWTDSAYRYIYRHVIVGGERGVDLKNPYVGKFPRVFTLLDHEVEDNCPFLGMLDEEECDWVYHDLYPEQLRTLVIRSPRILKLPGDRTACEAFHHLRFDSLIVYVGFNDNLVAEDNKENWYYAIGGGCLAITFVIGPNFEVAFWETKWYINVLDENVISLVRFVLAPLAPVNWISDTRAVRKGRPDDSEPDYLPTQDDVEWITKMILECTPIITMEEESKSNFWQPPTRVFFHSTLIPANVKDWGNDRTIALLNLELNLQWEEMVEELEERTGQTVSEERRQTDPMGQISVEHCGTDETNLDTLLAYFFHTIPILDRPSIFS